MSDLLTIAVARLSAYHYLVIAVNILLLVVARPLVNVLGSNNSARQMDFQVNVLRGLNLAILTAVFYFGVYEAAQDSGGLGLKLLSILIVFYLAYLASSNTSYLMRRRYGKVNSTADGIQISDTYHSRMLTLVASTFISIVALITIIRIAGFSSLLEAGGVIGFVGVFLALTQAAWAPDIISGLILLNSDMVSEGDLIEIAIPEPFLARVFKTKIFHTVLIDIVNNHRVMISNSKLRDYPIHSLSKFASARGLRERLIFKIGYDTESDRVKKMFTQAFATVCANTNSSLDETHALEIRVIEAGDHAVEWAIFYYIKEVQGLVATRHMMIETILGTSHEYGISLATPQTHVVTQNAPSN
ncbi:hypothetical protein AB833_08805 [Chromatiales bacterium (ex Bugula neritina AB1)]|nr:hypothetical protein AB833_08805 [Chromatiales bacterium (ex Bugula neritina AB1)]